VSPDRLEALLAAAPDIEVLVVGDLMLDRYVSGHVNRVSPEAPVPVVRVDTSESAVGGAGNVAANVTALGARCSVVGCVGEDPAADLLGGALTALLVGVGGVVRERLVFWQVSIRSSALMSNRTTTSARKSRQNWFAESPIWRRALMRSWSRTTTREFSFQL
jgi:hypothetical protein